MIGELKLKTGISPGSRACLYARGGRVANFNLHRCGLIAHPPRQWCWLRSTLSLLASFSTGIIDEGPLVSLLKLHILPPTKRPCRLLKGVWLQSKGRGRGRISASSGGGPGPGRARSSGPICLLAASRVRCSDSCRTAGSSLPERRPISQPKMCSRHTLTSLIQKNLARIRHVHQRR